ncbi:polysialyltransferase family glycosyltransferase [Pelagicoccus sp. SDUM812005]|uniref:polysialyltransferase family glycosyltransferase n=1 Tax=Pelagicoccus sp. SDUM812005 TaxID=3041257 RepID=UPI00280C88A6|nr:polysialyltransferase family glycosyltransferase [Pelagicoccus sp. SDUM812005]MDQ8180926.1 hypothetical protein [Pelagicoccus sp. SDUM812005]
MHALALADRFRSEGVEVEFMVASADRTDAGRDLAEFGALVEGSGFGRVVSTQIYNSSSELYGWLMDYVNSQLGSDRDVERFYLPCNEFNNFHSPSVDGIVALARILELKGVELHAFDHGPGDWLSSYDETHSDSLSYAKMITFSTVQVFDPKGWLGDGRCTVLDSIHCLHAIRTVGEFVKERDSRFFDSLSVESDSIFIIGGTYDYSIGRSCFEEYIRIIRQAKKNGITVYFKPHKHYYLEGDQGVIAELKREGAILVDAVSCGAEVLIELLKPIGVVGVCSSALRHSWHHLGVPAFTVVTASLMQSLLEGERANAGLAMSLKSGRYRFLEIMMNVCSLPHWDELDLSLWTRSRKTEYEEVLSIVKERSALYRTLLPMREMVFSNYLSRLSRIKGNCDDYYLYALDLCSENNCRFAVYGTGEGGRDVLRLAKNLGMSPVYMIDSKANEPFSEVFGVKVRPLDAVSDEELGKLDAIVVSSVTYYKEIVSKLRPVCESAAIRIIHFGDLVRS